MNNRISKDIALILLIFVFLLGLVGCNKGTDTMYVLGIMVDGVFYEKAYQPMPAEIDESAIIGHVAYYTDTFPTKDGETNISADLIGAPYARVEGGIALLCQNEWYLCTAETSATDEAENYLNQSVIYEESICEMSDFSEAPTLIVRYGEIETPAIRSTGSWTVNLPNGYGRNWTSDGPHALESYSAYTPISITGNTKLELVFELEPTEIAVHCWPENYAASIHESNELLMEHISKASELSIQDGFISVPTDCNYICEVVATWNDENGNNGTASYGFYCSISAP